MPSIYLPSPSKSSPLPQNIFPFSGNSRNSITGSDMPSALGIVIIHIALNPTWKGLSWSMLIPPSTLLLPPSLPPSSRPWLSSSPEKNSLSSSPPSYKSQTSLNGHSKIMYQTSFTSETANTTALPCWKSFCMTTRVSFPPFAPSASASFLTGWPLPQLEILP